MKSLTLASLLSFGSLVAAQDMSYCDKYTTAVFKDNSAANQQTLLTLVVNTAVIGNFSATSNGVVVPGILNPNGTYNGTKVNLVPYFDGSLNSTNMGGAMGQRVNFLDDGGAAPLTKGMPSNGNKTSNQYILLTHLYSYFGTLLGCSKIGQGFPAYAGDTSQYSVHKFMDLNFIEVSYFVEQVGLSAASYGVTSDDVTAIGGLLLKTFGYKCAPAAAIPSTAPAAPQAICIDAACPQSPNATCDAYAAVMTPAYANGSYYMDPVASSSSATGSASSTASASATGGSGSSGAESAFVLTSATVMVVLGALGFAVLM